MTRSTKRKGKRAKDLDPVLYTTKRWLRAVIMEAIHFWAPILKLESFVDQIDVFIAESDDKLIGEDSGASVVVDSTRRSASLRIKRSIVKDMWGEYIDRNYTPSEVVEATIIHELCHIIIHPMSQWAISVAENMKNNVILGNLFSREEEISVEHLTRVFHSLKEYISPDKKFRGTIKYISKE